MGLPHTRIVTTTGLTAKLAFFSMLVVIVTFLSMIETLVATSPVPAEQWQEWQAHLTGTNVYLIPAAILPIGAQINLTENGQKAKLKKACVL